MIATLSDLLTHIDALDPTGPPTLCNFAATGEPYVTVTSGGIYTDPEPLTYFGDRAEALHAFMAHFDRYLRIKGWGGRGVRIFWRCKPEYVRRHNPRGAHIEFCVFARVLVSDRAIRTRSNTANMPVLATRCHLKLRRTA